MYLSDRKVWIVPLEDSRIQLILSTTFVENGKSACEAIKKLMTDIDESKI